MSELLVLALKLAFLALLWLFVLFATNVIRTDLFGRRVPVAAEAAKVEPPRERKKRKPRKLPTTLRIAEGRQAGLTMPLGEMLKIGRSDDCQLVLDDDYVSTRHARIYASDDGFLVEDLGSTNGTFLNDQRISTPTPFTLSDTLRIGRTKMVVQK